MVEERQKILLVDDEPHILKSYARGLRKEFDMTTLTSPLEAIKLVEEHEQPFAVIVSDYNMPEMMGDVFLKTCHELSPDSVRVLLSGKTDIESIISCINEGHIFRFLLKPCGLPQMQQTLQESVRQFEILNTEKILFGQTLIATVQICVDFLTIHQPLVFTHVSKQKKQVELLCDQFDIQHKWRYTIAALLSHLGAVLLDSPKLLNILEKSKVTPDEQVFLNEMLKVSSKLISPIPKLELITDIILHHQTALDKLSKNPSLPIQQQAPLTIGCQLLYCTSHFNRLQASGQDIKEIIKNMLQQPNVFHVDIVKGLIKLPNKTDSIKAKVKIGDLTETMTAAMNIYDDNNNLIIVEGQLLNDVCISKLQQLLREHNIQPWIEVFIS
jgi:response regulator RpfG family c-di-GMP phosphodiesterase